VAQAGKFGAEILTPLQVCNLRLQDPYRILRLTDGSEISCHALVIASGVQYRTLDGVPGMDRLTGAGVYYGAAITEALACTGKDVFVVGGGNSAGQGAMYLSKFARSVTLLIRGAELAASMSHYLVQRIDEAPNVQVWPHTQVADVEGESQLEALRLVRDGEEITVPADALFIFIGAVPRTDWASETVLRDDYGYILTGADALKNGRPRTWNVQRDPFWLETSVPGVFAAGDVRHRSVKRVASAVGEGSMAVQFVHQHLASL
jgi:thioredoxin reductase (NADPH)